MHDVLVIGNGIFGSWATRLARQVGLQVQLVAAGGATWASHASAGLFCLEWLEGKGLDIEPVLRLGSGLYEELDFVVHRQGRVSRKRLYCLPYEKFAIEPDIRANVVCIHQEGGSISATTAEGELLEARCAYLACGVGTSLLFPSLQPEARWGKAIIYKPENLMAEPPRMSVWAPYKQAVAIRRLDGNYYFTDGTSTKSLEPIRSAPDERAARLFGFRREQKLEERLGMRPYLKDGPQLARDGNLWCATGGAKLGTVAGAQFAEQFLKEICGS